MTGACLAASCYCRPVGEAIAFTDALFFIFPFLALNAAAYNARKMP